EFCERFSYYGMRAVLTLYFLTYLGWDHDLSTAVYHAFSSLCYFTPVLGAIIADTWLGKFKTIIYLSVVYVLGHVIKSVGAIPTVGSNTVHIALSMVGLILIAFGTGGIKPCVAAFGGDQFQEKHNYFFNNNSGIVKSNSFKLPRGDVQCFGGDCYALAFGVPAALMMVALVVFILGSSLYRRNPPQGNILLEVCNCIGFAIKNRWRRSKYESKRRHWLDWAEDKYSKRLITEIKMVLRVLLLYIPLPMFWALFDQQGSRWTLQATRMNMSFGAFSIKPDQMQTLNALLILVFVPVFDLFIYPLVSLCRINITPLRKMATGMIFAALAFGAATLVEVHVVKTVVKPAPAGQCLLQVFNLAPGDVRLHFPESQPFPEPLMYLQDPGEYLKLPLGAPSTNVSLEVDYEGTASRCNVTFGQQEAYSLILHPSRAGIRCRLVSEHLASVASRRFVNTLSEAVTVTVGDETFHADANYSVSANKTLQRGVYNKVSCSLQSKTCPDLDLGLLDFGASYTVVLLESGRITTHKMEDVHANNVHVAWQIPQYVLITAGEVMFSITGLEFSYSQAPANMKSVLQAGWLLTVAFGNVIVLIIAEGAGLEQWKEFVLFAVLLLAVCGVFSVMAHFYTYVDAQHLDKMDANDHSGGQRSSKGEQSWGSLNPRRLVPP
uniref:Solute carrier family 15 member 2 n=1 Tax=Hippocampus comes TaxID=109280 RepID=A0A3Q2XA75_HIPCM